MLGGRGGPLLKRVQHYYIITSILITIITIACLKFCGSFPSHYSENCASLGLYKALNADRRG